jgi:hypothetical protein
MIVNAGNILPFYSRLSDQWRARTGDYSFGMIAKRRTILPFQVPYIGNETGWAMTLVYIAGLSDSGTEDDYGDSFIDTHCLADNSRQWITFRGLDTGLDARCGFCYIRLQSDSGTTFFSEVIRVVEDEYFVDNDIYSLNWDNSKDIDPLLYSKGYQQRFYFTGKWGFPDVVREQELSINGNGVERLTSSLTKNRPVIETPYIIDPMHYPLRLLRDHDRVILKNEGTLEQTMCLEPEAEFENGEVYATGAITFIDASLSRGCAEDLQVNAC